jgi:hypothetical protein
MRKTVEEKFVLFFLVLTGRCGECANGGDIRQIYSLHLSYYSLKNTEEINVFHKVQHSGINTTINTEHNGITDQCIWEVSGSSMGRVTV